MKKSSFKVMLATISLLGVVPVSVSTFTNHSVAPASDKNILTNHHSVIVAAKTLLNNVIKVREIEGKDASDETSLLAQLLILNPDLRIADVEVTSFYKPTEISPGAAMVAAKIGSDYSGVVGITITPVPKIELRSVITVAQVKGQVAPTEEALLRQIGYLNPRLTAEDVEVTNFTKATEVKEGTAVISALEGTKYTGEVTITITVLPKINLNDVIGIREVEGATANDEDTVLKEVARLNLDLDIDDVEVGDFKAASQYASGEFTVIAKENTKYTGEVTIVINALPKTALSTVITERTIEGSVANDEKTILAEIARLNPSLNITNVEIRYFNKATNITPGSVVISATTNSKYIGQVGITINPLMNFFFNKAVENDQEAVDIINSTRFSKSVNLNTTVNQLIPTIDTKFIKDRLVATSSNLINDNLFVVNKIFTNEGNELADSDLIAAKTLSLVVNYDYGSITNQEMQLILTVKQISMTTERSNLLRQIKIKLDKNEDDSEWSDAWFSYFKQLQIDIRSFSFQFPEEELNQNEILQNIIYDEVKLVMEVDFKFWNIEKGYDPNSVVITYDDFKINEEDKEFSAKGRIAMQIEAYGTYVKHSIRFDYQSELNFIPV